MRQNIHHVKISPSSRNTVTLAYDKLSFVVFFSPSHYCAHVCLHLLFVDMLPQLEDVTIQVLKFLNSAVQLNHSIKIINNI